MKPACQFRIGVRTVPRANGRWQVQDLPLLEGAGRCYLAGRAEPGRDRGRAGLALVCFGHRPASVDDEVCRPCA
jgi:hypothetical protein